jgi:23S rRNA (guanosine2251-2'-O)-methyltransferase
MKSKMIFGFHAVTSRIRHEASSVEEIYVDNDRSDRRMQDLIHAAKSVGLRIIQTDDQRLAHGAIRVLWQRQENFH